MEKVLAQSPAAYGHSLMYATPATLDTTHMESLSSLGLLACWQALALSLSLSPPDVSPPPAPLLTPLSLRYKELNLHSDRSQISPSPLPFLSPLLHLSPLSLPVSRLSSSPLQCISPSISLSVSVASLTPRSSQLFCCVVAAVAAVVTWLRATPMQLPIPYSMSSSGDLSALLHGWQKYSLQNCIAPTLAAAWHLDAGHSECEKATERECESASVPLCARTSPCMCARVCVCACVTEMFTQ